jgi:hypothetical protein
MHFADSWQQTWTLQPLESSDAAITSLQPHLALPYSFRRTLGGIRRVTGSDSPANNPLVCYSLARAAGTTMALKKDEKGAAPGPHGGSVTKKQRKASVTILPPSLLHTHLQSR